MYRKGGREERRDNFVECGTDGIDRSALRMLATSQTILFVLARLLEVFSSFHVCRLIAEYG